MASLATGRIEDGKLILSAVYNKIAQPRSSPSTNHVREGRDPVHEDPEPGKGRRLLQNAVEGQRHAEEEGRNIACRLCIGHGSDNHLGKS